jgi:hypothetical protein
MAKEFKVWVRLERDEAGRKILNIGGKRVPMPANPSTKGPANRPGREKPRRRTELKGDELKGGVIEG